MNVTQRNAILARETLAAVRGIVYSEIQRISVPDDYATNDDASMAYEAACLAVRAEHDIDGAERLAREAEDAMIAWAIGIARTHHGARLGEHIASLEYARTMPTYRDRLVDLCLRLRA